MKKIVLIGVIGGQITGQVITTNKVIDIVSRAEPHNKCRLIEQPFKFSIKSMLWYYIQTIRYLYFERPSVVYLSFSRTKKSFYARDLIVLLSVLLFKLPCVLHLVGNDFANFVRRCKVAHLVYARVLQRKTACLISLSTRMEDDVSKALNLQNKSKDWRVVPGFVENNNIVFSDLNLLDVQRSGLKTIVGFMSNLLPEKGIFDFIDAAEYLKSSDSGCNFEFWIAGVKQPYVDYSKLESAVARGIVRYRDFVSGLDKEILLRSTSIFVLPSYYKTEALPLALVEAALFGNYIISCDTGDIKQLVSGCGGVIIPPRSPMSIADAILNFDRKSHFPSLTSAYIDENYSLTTFEQKILGIFNMK